MLSKFTVRQLIHRVNLNVLISFSQFVSKACQQLSFKHVVTYTVYFIMCNRWGDILSPICISFLGFYRIAYFLLLKVYMQCKLGKSAKSFSHSFVTDTACNALQGRLSCLCLWGGGGCDYCISSPPAPHYFYADFGSDPAKATLHLSLSHLSQYSKCKWHKITQPRFFSCSEPEFVQTNSQPDVPTRQPRLTD
jgi:hypothetical protein